MKLVIRNTFRTKWGIATRAGPIVTNDVGEIESTTDGKQIIKRF